MLKEEPRGESAHARRPHEREDVQAAMRAEAARGDDERIENRAQTECEDEKRDQRRARSIGRGSHGRTRILPEGEQLERGELETGSRAAAPFEVSVSLVKGTQWCVG